MNDQQQFFIYFYRKFDDFKQKAKFFFFKLCFQRKKIPFPEIIFHQQFSTLNQAFFNYKLFVFQWIILQSDQFVKSMNKTIWDCSRPEAPNPKIQGLHRFPKYKIKNPNLNNKPICSKEKTSLRKNYVHNKSSHQLATYSQNERKLFDANKSQRIAPIAMQEKAEKRNSHHQALSNIGNRVYSNEGFDFHSRNISSPQTKPYLQGYAKSFKDFTVLRNKQISSNFDKKNQGKVFLNTDKYSQKTFENQNIQNKLQPQPILTKCFSKKFSKELQLQAKINLNLKRHASNNTFLPPKTFSQVNKNKEFFMWKKTTVEELMNQNSLKISINSSDGESQASQVIATHRQIQNQDGWLPLSLTETTDSLSHIRPTK